MKIAEIHEMGGFLELTRELTVFMALDEEGVKASHIAKKSLKTGTLVRIDQIMNNGTVVSLEDINTQDRCLVRTDDLEKAIK